MAKTADEKNKDDQGRNTDKGAKIGVAAAFALIVAGIGWGLSKIFRNIKEKK
jgi:hypothetical protein